MATKRGFCLNPRGTLWANDANKFGQKMLEKMGWKHGKGLGAHEDGLLDPIRIPYKNDNKGLGCQDVADPWLNNQEKYNDLLLQLNGHVEGCPEEQLVSSNLTEKSKCSRKRVHYHKFSRSKDLSCRSVEELASVLGDRSLIKMPRKLKEDVEVNSNIDVEVPENLEDKFEEKRQTRKRKGGKTKSKDESANEENDPVEETDSPRKKRFKKELQQDLSSNSDSKQAGLVAVDKSGKKKARLEHAHANYELSECPKIKKEDEEVTSETQSQELTSVGDASKDKPVKKKCKRESVFLSTKKQRKKDLGLHLSGTIINNGKSSAKKEEKKGVVHKSKKTKLENGGEENVEDMCDHKVKEDKSTVLPATREKVLGSSRKKALNWSGIELFKGSNFLSLKGYGNGIM